MTLLFDLIDDIYTLLLHTYLLSHDRVALRRTCKALHGRDASFRWPKWFRSNMQPIHPLLPTPRHGEAIKQLEESGINQIAVGIGPRVARITFGTDVIISLAWHWVRPNWHGNCDAASGLETLCEEFVLSAHNTTADGSDEDGATLYSSRIVDPPLMWYLTSETNHSGLGSWCCGGFVSHVGDLFPANLRDAITALHYDHWAADLSPLTQQS
jgi:hypothetical protein